MIAPTGDPMWEQRRRNADKTAALWEKMEWFSPLWVPRGKVEQLLKETEHCQKERAVELFDYHTSTIYTLAFKAVCIAQILPEARSLREFCPIAREAYLAFYSGYRASSIAALIPAIEGSLSRIVLRVLQLTCRCPTRSTERWVLPSIALRVSISKKCGFHGNT